MRHKTMLALMLLLIFLPAAACSAEWNPVEGKFAENPYGTKYYTESKLSYAESSTAKNPIVVTWGKTVFNGKADPDYAKLMQRGCPPETAAVELKFWVDINNKKLAIAFGILYDAQGRILSTDEVKNPEYMPIPPGTGAESRWAAIKDLHEKGLINR